MIWLYSICRFTSDHAFLLAQRLVRLMKICNGLHQKSAAGMGIIREHFDLLLPSIGNNHLLENMQQSIELDW